MSFVSAVSRRALYSATSSAGTAVRNASGESVRRVTTRGAGISRTEPDLISIQTLMPALVAGFAVSGVAYYLIRCVREKKNDYTTNGDTCTALSMRSLYIYVYIHVAVCCRASLHFSLCVCLSLSQHVRASKKREMRFVLHVQIRKPSYVLYGRS